MSGTTETQVWKIVSEHPNLTAAQLGPKLKTVTKKELVSALNALLAKDLVKVSKTGDNQLVWKAVDISDAKTKNAMAGDERMVFSAIEASGNQGIWSRTITSQTNLPNAVVTKILNKLQSSKQIKMVKSVKHPTRKMYMVSHIEPSVDLTGGPWYTDFELDPSFIGMVKEVCLRFVTKKSFPDADDTSRSAPLFPSSATGVDRYPTLNDVTRFIRSAKVTETNLLPEHIEEIMNVLIYEGLIERLPGSGERSSAHQDSDSDDDDAVQVSKSKSKKRRRDGSSEEEIKRKKKSRRPASASDSESSSADDRRGRKKKGRKKDVSDSESSSDSDSDSKRGRKRRHDSASDSGSESDRKSTSSKRRKTPKSKRSKSRSRPDDSDTMGTESTDDEGGNTKKTRGKKDKKEDDGEDVDLETAFGHLMGNGSVYRAIRQERVGLGWSQAPCGRCPQLDFCEDNGPVNPTGCKYYGDWLTQALGD